LLRGLSEIDSDDWSTGHRYLARRRRPNAASGERAATRMEDEDRYRAMNFSVTRDARKEAVGPIGQCRPTRISLRIVPAGCVQLAFSDRCKAADLSQPLSTPAPWA
jgi:hypothetical protein